jgi:histidinol dehydrogenase
MVVFGQVDIDSPAGPSEGLILADDTADPDWLAVDFFTQLEHDPDAASVLVTTDPKLAAETAKQINKLFQEIPRREIVRPALENHSAVLVADSWDQAFDFVNQYAAEHLQIITRDPWTALPRIRHAGSIFLGPHAPIPVGDYASGTNHILPTGRAARMFSGLSVDDFLKKSSFQYLSRDGLASLESAVTTLADAEGLPTHAAAVRKRFE